MLAAAGRDDLRGRVVASGARAVVASLWSVEDQIARDFVLRFYQEGGEEDPLGALTRAQRSFLAEGRPAESWAPFVLLGSPRALVSRTENGGES